MTWKERGSDEEVKGGVGDEGVCFEGDGCGVAVVIESGK